MACLGFCLPCQSIDLCTNNKSAILLIKTPEFHRKRKYITVRWYQIWEKLKQKEIIISYISTKEVWADRLTKTQNPKISKNFWRMIEMSLIGLICLSRSNKSSYKND